MSVDITLYGIVDPQIANGRSMADMARAAVEGGATLIQLRAKTETTREMVREARAIRSALHGTNVPLLINDRVDVALAAGADGVHLGADDMKLVDARRLLGPRAIIGATLRRRSRTVIPGPRPAPCPAIPADPRARGDVPCAPRT